METDIKENINFFTNYVFNERKIFLLREIIQYQNNFFKKES